MKSIAEQKAEGKWKQFKGKVKQIWGNLTDDDLDRYEGRVEELVGRLQEESGEDRAAIRRQIDQIAEEMKYRV